MTTDTNTQTVEVSTASVQKKRGFTLTEIAIVLGIIGLILGAVWTAASGVYASANASKIAQSMGNYVAAIRSACAAGCVAVPAVSVGYPNTTSTPATVAASVLTTAPIGYIQLAYSAIPQTKEGANLISGLSAAANLVGATFADTAGNAATVATNTPTCNGSGGTAAAPKPAICTAVAGYNAKYIGSSTCTVSNAVGGAIGTCAYAITTPPTTAAVFLFAPTF